MPPCSCTISNVYNQEAYAHNISVNRVFTLLDYLRIKNTHLLFMTLSCRYSVGCLCVLVFTVHALLSGVCFKIYIYTKAQIRAEETLITFQTEFPLNSEDRRGKRVVLIMLSFRALAYGSLQALVTLMYSVSSM